MRGDLPYGTEHLAPVRRKHLISDCDRVVHAPSSSAKPRPHSLPLRRPYPPVWSEAITSIAHAAPRGISAMRRFLLPIQGLRTKRAHVQNNMNMDPARPPESPAPGSDLLSWLACLAWSPPSCLCLPTHTRTIILPKNATSQWLCQAQCSLRPALCLN